MGDEIADQFIKRFPLTKTKTRFGGAGIDIAEAAMIDLAFAGVHQVVDSMPRVHAATQYLEEDPELAELCRTDGEGPAELAERIDNISHSMCTLEKPTVVLAPPRRARQQNTRRPPPRPHRA